MIKAFTSRSLAAIRLAIVFRRSWSVFPLVSRLSSTSSAAGCPVLFASFAGTTRLSDFPRSFISGLRPWPSPSGPSHHHNQTGNRGTSRFSRLETQRMHRLSDRAGSADSSRSVSYTHLRAHETRHDLVCRLLLEKKKKKKKKKEK